MTGHDVDILITHPDLGKEKEILTNIIKVLGFYLKIVNFSLFFSTSTQSVINKIDRLDYVIYGRHENEGSKDWTKSSSKNIMDHFERFISILKFPLVEETPPSCDSSPQIKRHKAAFEQPTLDEILKEMDVSKFKRNWSARRVDIIVCPINQFPFALLGLLNIFTAIT